MQRAIIASSGHANATQLCSSNIKNACVCFYREANILVVLSIKRNKRADFICINVRLVGLVMSKLETRAKFKAESALKVRGPSTTRKV
jgi:hypothetical protein